MADSLGSYGKMKILKRKKPSNVFDLELKQKAKANFKKNHPSTQNVLK